MVRLVCFRLRTGLNLKTHRGFYYWYGLDRGWLEWTPEVRYPVKKNTLVHGHTLSWDVEAQ